MKKIWLTGGVSFGIFIALCVFAWFNYERWPFQAQIWFAMRVERPPHMAHPPVSKRLPIQNRLSFAKWVTAAAMCESDFMKQVQDRTTLVRIKSLGVKGVQLDEIGTPDGTWQVPVGMISVFGAPVSRIHFWGDSGSEFVLKLAMSPEAVIQRIGAGRPARYLQSDGYQAVLLTEPITLLQPFPLLVFVEPADEPGYAYLGCRMYDY